MKVIIEAKAIFSNCSRNEKYYLQRTRASHTEYPPFTSWELVVPPQNLLLLKLVFDFHQMPAACLYLLL